jgi:hypothetical protein
MLKNSYAMLSLTKQRNNLLMWSHYSASHQGFVIGFDAAHPFFNTQKPRIMTDLSEVTYSDRRVIVPKLEELENERIIET